MIRMLTCTDVARIARVSRGTVSAWIQSGDLVAVDVASCGTTHRYRIREEDLAAFLEARRAKAVPAPRRRRRPVEDLLNVIPNAARIERARSRA